MDDFTDVVENSVQLEAVDDEADSDFSPTGDEGLIIIEGHGFGEGGFGTGPFGGEVTLIVSAPTTEWTNIDEP